MCLRTVKVEYDVQSWRAACLHDLSTDLNFDDTQICLKMLLWYKICNCFKNVQRLFKYSSVESFEVHWVLHAEPYYWNNNISPKYCGETLNILMNTLEITRHLNWSTSLGTSYAKLYSPTKKRKANCHCGDTICCKESQMKPFCWKWYYCHS